MVFKEPSLPEGRHARAAPRAAGRGRALDPDPARDPRGLRRVPVREPLLLRASLVRPDGRRLDLHRHCALARGGAGLHISRQSLPRASPRFSAADRALRRKRGDELPRAQFLHGPDRRRGRPAAVRVRASAPGVLARAARGARGLAESGLSAPHDPGHVRRPGLDAAAAVSARGALGAPRPLDASGDPARPVHRSLDVRPVIARPARAGDRRSARVGASKPRERACLARLRPAEPAALCRRRGARGRALVDPQSARTIAQPLRADGGLLVLGGDVARGPDGPELAAAHPRRDPRSDSAAQPPARERAGKPDAERRARKLGRQPASRWSRTPAGRARRKRAERERS